MASLWALLLTLVLTAVYVGLILGLSALLRGVINQDSSVAIVQPVRQRLQQSIDRRFYRRTYDGPQSSRRSTPGCAARWTWIR